MTPAATNIAPDDALATAFSQWRKTVDAELKGVPFEKKLVTRTPEGIALQPLYTRADRAGLPDLDSAPGEAPFLRGTRAHGYKNSAWQVAQTIVAPTPAAFNAALLADLMTGQDAIVLTPDRATLDGLDPDEAPTASVGAGGVSIADSADLDRALKGVDLTAVPVHLRCGADPLPIAALHLELARSRGIEWRLLTGGVTSGPLGTLAETGALPMALDTALDLLAGWTSWAAENTPALRTVEVNTAWWNHAGATAVQELAFALAEAAEYIRAMDTRGVPVATTAARIRFETAAGPQFFTEIAKFRALRSLWTRVVVAFGAPAAVAAEAWVHASTSRRDQTLLDAHVNMLRSTTEALSAVLGGVDSLHVAPFDEVKGATDDFSRRIARNVHTLLAEEFAFTQTADPAGGSWYVEKLTDELARRAWVLFQEIEARGGFVAALRAGGLQEMVAKAVAEKSDAVSKRRLGLVGTNLFPNLKERMPTPAVRDGAALQAARAREIRARRHPAFPPGDNGWSTRFAAALAAAKHGATISQLSRIGHAKSLPEAPVKNVPISRASEGFEQLRRASDAFTTRTGARPKVFLAKMGPTLQHKARADFSAGFFAVGGFEAVGRQTFDTADAAASAAAESGAPIAVLCSTDETYPALVPAFVAAAKAAKPSIKIVLAGLPADAATVEAFRAAGIDEFIHLRADTCAILARSLRQMGALS